jgi:hypothetical protein
MAILGLESLDFTGRDVTPVATLPATTANPKAPSGSLVGTSSSGANWLTVLSEPFNRYFLNQATLDERKFQLQFQAEQGAVQREINAVRSKNYLTIAAYILGAAVVLGLLKRKR